MTQERVKLRESLDNLKQERSALIEQIQMMSAKMAPRTAVKNRFNEIAKIDYWD
jgi:hypothetical protein